MVLIYTSGLGFALDIAAGMSKTIGGLDKAYLRQKIKNYE